MGLSNLTRDLEGTIKRLEEEGCGEVLRKVMWLFVGGDTSRWFEGKPQKSLPTTPSNTKQELLSRHYSTEFLACRVYRTCTVNYELSSDQRAKTKQNLEKLEGCGLVESVNTKNGEDQQYWKLTKLGLACALAIKQDIQEGNSVNWNVEEVRRQMKSLEKVCNS
ncbi:MAG: hypothetical protein V5A79_02955 [Candidatus Bipolaricaulota bacterium]